MVSNYDRVYQEIRAEALRVGGSDNIPRDDLVQLAMEIVDAEDQNRTRAIHNINQRIVGMIRNAATKHIDILAPPTDGDHAEVP